MSRNERSQWFLNRLARPADDEQAKLLGSSRQSSESVEFNWAPLGPFNVAGRSTSLAVDPRNPQRVFLGSAGGGLWLTEDSGKSWVPQTDRLRSLSIGAVAFAPGNPDIAYLGTGEANLALDSYPGCGVFRSYPKEEFASGWGEIGSAGGSPSLPNRIGAIAVDPFDEDHLFIASATIVDDDSSGLYEGRRRSDGTYSWEFVTGAAFQKAGSSALDDKRPGQSRSTLPRSGPYQCHSVIFDPTAPGMLYAAVNLRGSVSGLYVSRDSGQSWINMVAFGFPAGERLGRASLAVGKSRTRSVLWAYAAHAREGMLGVFRSDNRVWHSVGQEHFAGEATGSFSNCIAVHPAHPDWVVCGGKDLHRTTDNGETWQQITECDLPETDPHFAHADHHALAITPEGWIYDANGGGLSFSRDFGKTWTRRSDGLVTSMFYKVDVATPKARVVVGSYQMDQTTPGASVLLGGLHNDGVLFHAATPDEPAGCFQRELRDEGGWVIFDPDDPAHMFATGPGAALHRHTTADGWTHVSPPDLTDDETSQAWLPIIAMDASQDRAKPRPLLFGTTRLWKSSDDGETWRPVSVELDGSPVSAIHICPADSRRIYAGTEWGAIFCSEDGGNTWSENLGGIDLPYRYITRIASHPADALHVLLAIGPNPPPPVAGVAFAYSHLYLSTDGGRTWRNASPNGDLPNAPHNCVAFHADGTPFVATDFGVYGGGWSKEKKNYTYWRDLSGDLPNAFVMDLVVHSESGTLTAATYGRGLFRHKLGSDTAMFEMLADGR